MGILGRLREYFDELLNSYLFDLGILPTEDDEIVIPTPTMFCNSKIEKSQYI